jgi:hypothetical protein
MYEVLKISVLVNKFFSTAWHNAGAGNWRLITKEFLFQRSLQLTRGTDLLPNEVCLRIELCTLERPKRE